MWVWHMHRAACPGTASKLRRLATMYVLERFLKTHYHASHYAFQIKKCSDASCFYCLEHPVRLLDSVFSTLIFLPLPLLEKSTNEYYQKYSDLYGQEPSEVGRASLVPTPSEESKQVDKGRKSLLVCGKVHCIVTCGECYKPRCVYSQPSLMQEKPAKLQVLTNLTCTLVVLHYFSLGLSMK